MNYEIVSRTSYFMIRRLWCITLANMSIFSRRSSHRLLAAVLAAVFLAMVMPVNVLAGEPNLPVVDAPWMKGERLEFNLSWGPITAGTATLEVKSAPDGKTEFYTMAHDKGTFKRLYPVADTIYTRVRNKGLMTEVFRKTLHEGSYHNKSVIRFDRKGEKAWLSDTVFTDPVKRTVKRSADTVVAIKGMEHSIMSAFYLVRTMPLTVGETSKFSAVSGKKRYELKVITHGREKMKTVLGEVNTVKVEPVLDGDGIFVSKGRIFIWLTDDERRIPVLMECEIALGSIKAKLISAK
ncbi:MAG: DUF3108 domain-containing protein [Fibrobacter sp.]|nr:DUF3108 domain-containing protein [Fibrobacter sp.]